MSTRSISTIFLCTFITVAVVGCGKPVMQGGPPEDFKVQAVIAPVVPQTLEERIQLIGSLQAREAVTVVSEINAMVTALHFEEGSAVKAGMVLVELDNRKWAARGRESEARLQLARTNYERAADLLKSDTISQQEYDQLKAEFDVAEASNALVQTELDDTTIVAPFSGVIAERQVSVGQFVTAGQVITQLVQTDPLEATFQVPERHLARLARGQNVSLSSVAFPGETFDGTVFYIDPRVNEVSRSVRMKAEVPNPDGLLKPGMFVSLELLIQQDDDAMLIPESAVQFNGDQAIVFIMNDDDAAEIRPVTLGVRREETVQVLEGLVPGDRVVVEGYQKMFPGVGILISPESARYGLEPAESATL